MKAKLRSTAVLVASAILFQIFPVQSLAKTQPTNGATSDIAHKKSIVIIGEDDTRRQRNVKEFKQSDGSYIAAVYPFPIHVQKDEKWVDIDNTLQPQSQPLSKSTLLNGNSATKFYAPKNSNFDVRLSENTADENLITLGGDLGIGFVADSNQTKTDSKIELQQTQAIVPLSAESKTVEETNWEKLTLQNLVSVTQYRDVLPDTDLEYILSPIGIKENIVVHKKKDSYQYYFTLNLDGLTAEQLTTQQINIYDNDSLKYIISASQMTDAAGNSSGLVSCSLNGNIITIEADKSWINSAEREFPVKIDPSVTDPSILDDTGMSATYSSAMISSAKPTQALGKEFASAPNLFVGKSSTYGIGRALIDLPENFLLDYKRTITSAYLYLGLVDYNSSGNKDETVSLYKITENWNSETVTWNNQPDYESSVACEKLDGLNAIASDTLIPLDVTNIMRDHDCKGIMITSDNENEDCCVEFGRTANAFDTDNYMYPQYIYTYVSNVGLESYWDFTTASAGRAGDIYVNNRTGELYLDNTIAGLNGNIMPVSYSMMYYFPSPDTSRSDVFGTRWHGSYSERLIATQSTDSQFQNKYPYYLVEQDGTTKYFEQVYPGLIADETGSGAELSGRTITDKAGNQMVFNDTGYLVKLVDSNGNTIDITRSGNQVLTVKDGSARTFTYSYNTEGLLSQITQPDGTAVELEYTAWDQTQEQFVLTSVTYPDEKSVSYEYDSIPRLTKIIDTDLSYIKIDYAEESTGKISKLTEYGSDGTEGTSLTFEYLTGASTKITDNTGKYNLLRFDPYNRLSSIVDQDGRSLNYQHTITTDSSEDINTRNRLTLSSKLQSHSINLLDDSALLVESEGSTTASYTQPEREDAPCGKVHALATTGSTGKSYLYQDIALTPGKTYTLSAYISSNLTFKSQPDAGGFLSVVFPGSDTAELTSSYVQADEFIRKSLTFTMPDDCTDHKARLRFAATANAQTVSFDGMQLEESDSPNRVNLLINSDFSVMDGSLPKYWGPLQTDDTVHGSRGNYDAQRNLYPFHITGNVKNQEELRQSVSVRGKGNTLIVSGWAKANALPDNIDQYRLSDGSYSYPTDRAFGILVRIHYNNLNVKAQYVPFDPYITGEQYVSAVIDTKLDGEALSYYQVDVSVVYHHNGNTASFYDLGLYCDAYGNSYAYDKNGNLTSSVDAAKDATTLAGDENGNISRLTDPRGKLVLYNYDDHNNLTSVKTAGGVKSYFQYDAKGNVTKSEVYSHPNASAATANTWYHIINKKTGLAITAEASSSSLTQNHYSTGNAGTKFQLVASSGRYLILSGSGTGRYISADGSGDYSTASLTSQSQADKFYLTSQNGGFLITAENGRRLTVKPGESEKEDYIYSTGSTVVTDEQTWLLETVTPPAGNKITASAVYTASGQYPAAVTDELGNTTSYQYQESKGQLQSVTNAKNHTTSYTYLPNTNLLSKVSVPNGSLTHEIEYTYENDRLKQISAGDSLYQFSYDCFGNPLTTLINTFQLVTNHYQPNNGLLDKVTYGSGDVVDYVYNDRDELISRSLNNTEQYRWSYDKNGNVFRHQDFVNNTTWEYSYDEANRLRRVQSGLDELSFDYGKDNLLASRNFYFSVMYNFRQDYQYNDDGQLTTTDTHFGYTDPEKNASFLNTYDDLGRLYARGVSDSATGGTSYDYYYYRSPAAGQTSSQVSKVIGDGTWEYEYDELGNITQIKKDGVVRNSYQYDALGQLIRENNSPLDKTITYEYDGNGNIQKKYEYDYTLAASLDNANLQQYYTYSYNPLWKDQLVSYTVTENGITTTLKEIEIPETGNIGNPESYNGYTLSWEGRRLVEMSDADSEITFKYNADGYRTEKIVDGKSITYTLDGGKIIRLYDSSITTRMLFIYDANGELLGFHMRDSYTPYYYQKNLQGDIIGIYRFEENDNGLTEKVFLVRYEYDSWGKLISMTDGDGNAIPSTSTSHVGNVNPFRYRGYYYDSESGLYYLNSRYYDPEVGRFINADGYASTGQGVLGSNMFIYCNNNPVMYKDPSGQFLISALVVGAAVVGMAFLFTADSHQTVESHQQQQRKAAEQKYNQNTVNVYTPSSGKAEKGKVNVLIDKNNKNSAGQSDPNIHIENSYQITDSYEMEAILNVVIASPEYDSNVFPRTINSYIREWKGHNFMYNISSGSWKNRAMHVDLNNLEDKMIVWDVISTFIYIE